MLGSGRAHESAEEELRAGGGGGDGGADGGGGEGAGGKGGKKKARGKKVIDPTLLGFSVESSRIMQGEIEHAE